MEKKQIKLSTQKKIIFIPISFVIIYGIACNNLEPITFKERFNINFRVFLATLVICPFIVLVIYLHNSENLFSENLTFGLAFAFAYVINIAVSLVLIQYQKKMGVK